MEPEWLEALRRNSGLALSRDGVWTWGGRQVENPRVQDLFHQGVRVRDDGEVTLSVGRMWAYVESEGPIYFIRAVHSLGSSGASCRLLGGRVLPLLSGVEGRPPTAAGWGPDERLYLWLAGLDGPAICLREAHQILSSRIVELEDRPALALGDPSRDRPIAITTLAAIPSAGAQRPT